MRNSFIDVLLQKAKQDERIILLTGDLGYGVVDQFARELPRQFINFGINEQTMMSAAGGLASKGFKPFVYSIGNFPTFRCLEQIRNDVCYMNLDVTIVALGAGFAYGTAGYSHHLIEDISAISPLPHIQIFSPADTFEAKIVAEKITSFPGPKYVRLGKGGEGSITSNFDHTILGLSVRRGSKDLAIVSTGNILSEVLTAREILESEKPTVISCYDFAVLTGFLQKENYTSLIAVEEHLLRGGFGSFIQENLRDCQSVLTRIGIEKIDTNISGSQGFLRSKYGIDSKKITSLLT